jgi:hypothetical protein
MSDGLAALLGITPSGEDIVDRMDSSGEFDEFKDEPRPEVKFELQVKETSVPDLQLSDAKVDYAYARSMNYTLLEMTTQALARALAVANETEHPRAFESFNSLATTARGLTQDLLALQKVFKEVTKGRTELDPPPVAQTNIQINGDVNTGGAKGGSSVDIMNLLRDSIARGEISPLGVGHVSDVEDVEVKEVKDGEAS